MAKLSASIIQQCKEILIRNKEQLMNSLHSKPPTVDGETSGDWGDQNNRAIEEYDWIVRQTRARRQLTEIESALSRIENGIFGICEETGLLIETRRLLAIPWTRFSVEGASVQERIRARL